MIIRFKLNYVEEFHDGISVSASTLILDYLVSRTVRNKGHLNHPAFCYSSVS